MSAQKDLLTKVADARPRRLDPEHRGDPTAIMARSTALGVAHRPVRRRLLIALVPTAAVVAAGAVAVTSFTGTDERGPVVGGATSAAPEKAPETARELFLVAAERTEQEGATTGRYWVLDTEQGEVTDVGPAGHRYRILRRNELQHWLPTGPADGEVVFSRSLGAAPASAADEAAWRADGSPSEWTQRPADDPTAPGVVIRAAPDAGFSGPRSVPSRGSVVFAGGPVSMAELAALPTDPAALRQWVVERYGRASGGKVDDYSLFVMGQQLVAEIQVSPRVRAAAYRMMADLKGAQSLGAATDRRGRDGVAVAFMRRGDGGWAQSRLIVDPRTGQALADERWFYGSGASAARTGTLMGYTLVVSARYSNDNPKAS